MNKIFLLCAMTAAAFMAAAGGRTPGVEELEALHGITHYGLPIQEIRETFHKKGATLEIIYSKMLSDDNMDKYVKRFYDEFLRQIRARFNRMATPAPDMRIVISNCKFCKVGYCRKKNVRELSLVFYKNEKKDREIAFTHHDIIDRSQYKSLSIRAARMFFGE
jgi:hypothetical protein